MIADTKSIHVISSTSSGRREVSFYKTHTSSSIKEANFNLLEPKNGTMTRASEASMQDPRISWAFVGTSSVDNWKASNVTRVFPDGAVLIEGSRTNWLRRSSELDVTANWTNGATNASASAETEQAPDLGLDADLIYFQDTTVNPQIRQTIAASNFTNNVSGVFTMYFKSTGSSVTEELRMFTRQKDGSTIDNTAVTASGEWTRFTHRFYQGSGTIGPLAGIRNGDSGGIKTFYGWGAQVEPDWNYPTTYIRTTTVGVTRATDFLTFTVDSSMNDWLRRGFVLDFWPEWASNEAANASGNATLFCVGNALLRIYRSGNSQGTWALQGGNPVAVQATTANLVHSRYEHLRFKISCTENQIWSIRVENLSQATAVVATSINPVTHSVLLGQTLALGQYQPLANTYAIAGVIGLPRKL